MIKQLTEGVEISVQTRFLPAESSIRHGHYFFMYEIIIISSGLFIFIRRACSPVWHIFLG